MYVIKNKNTRKYLKSHTSEVDLQEAKIYKNKLLAEKFIKFRHDMDLEILEILNVKLTKEDAKLLRDCLSKTMSRGDALDFGIKLEEILHKFYS